MPGGVLTDRDAPVFDVHLENFSGPFGLLLALISRRRLELSEVALATVTDDFIAHLRRMFAEPEPAASTGPQGQRTHHGRPQRQSALGQASGFLVVAATLLDLKAARLLPAPHDDDAQAEDQALLEARDLLFARLLQHRAYARIADDLGQRLRDGAQSAPRPGGTGAPAEHPTTPPEQLMSTTAQELAALAAAALLAPSARTGRSAPVDLEHLHAPSVSVPEQVELVRRLLLAAGPGTDVTFDDLLIAAGGAPVAAALVVARFLAVLELYRRGEADLQQPGPRAPLVVRSTGASRHVVPHVPDNPDAPPASRPGTGDRS